MEKGQVSRSKPVKFHIDRTFESIEDAIYVLISLLLVATAVLLIVNAVTTLVEYETGSSFVQWVVEVLDKILLLLMVIEILYTVRVSLREHSLRPEPFLIVGLIAAIRRVLVISVETAYLPERFTEHMIEIGILGGLVLVFVGCMIIIRRFRKAST